MSDDKDLISVPTNDLTFNPRYPTNPGVSIILIFIGFSYLLFNLHNKNEEEKKI